MDLSKLGLKDDGSKFEIYAGKVDKSILYKFSPWSFGIMEAGVLGLQLGLRDKPELYAKVKADVQLAIIALNGSAPTIEELSKIPGIAAFVVGTLQLMFEKGVVLSRCDADLISNYLKRI